MMSGLSGGSQLPFWQIQFDTGAVPLHVPSFAGAVVSEDASRLLSGGSQLPFWQTQPAPGCTDVQLLVDVVPPEPGGSQLPFTHVQPVPG
jgi:hypothetical protein